MFEEKNNKKETREYGQTPFRYRTVSIDGKSYNVTEIVDTDGTTVFAAASKKIFGIF